MNSSSGHSYRTDEDYIRVIKAGGEPAEAAIKSLYLQYRTTVSSAFHKLVRQYPAYRGDIRDLLHDSFLVLIRKLEFGPFEVHNLCAFWKGIGKKLLLNQLKKDERLQLMQDVEGVYGLTNEFPPYTMLETDEREALAFYLAELGPRCREVLLLWISRYSMPEIAARLQLRDAAMARKIKYECFKKLKEKMKSGHKWPESRH
jgi:DNA-directed RNA polymerase specialized sigma24 family protein